MEVFAVFSQVENRIDDQLVWTMKSDIAPPVGPLDLYSLGRVLCSRKEQILFVEAGAQSQHGWVFHKDQSVVPLSRLDLFLNLPLNIPSRQIT